MKTCPKCKAEVADDVNVCPVCGEQLTAPAQDDKATFDHTSEFDPKDISDNKVISMLVYLLGLVGVLFAMIAGTKSDYVAFHVRQSLKITVVEILLSIVTVLLCWTFIVPIAASVCAIILLVLRIIAFFQICKGKACEPAIIRGLKFLK